MKTSWTQEQVDALNQRQREGKFHPYTCGTVDCGEYVTASNWRGQEHSVFFRSELTATQKGWVCLKCGYTQDWY